MDIDEKRFKLLEEEVEDLKRHFDDLLRIMLSRKKLTPEQRRAIRRKTAAFARAEKIVGKGRGKVSSEEIQEKLQKDKKDV